MAKKNQKNMPKNAPSNTTVQTGRNGKNEAQECKTEHPEKPDVRNY